MISKELLELIFAGADIERWNDHFHPHKGFTELDKQAHKVFYMYVLQKFERPGRVNLRLLIEGCMFEYFHRVILTDIKPPVFHKLMAEKGGQINRYVLEKIAGECKGIGDGFYEKFERYLFDPEYAENEKHIINAAHYLATAWEFDIVYPMSQKLYGIENVKEEIEAQVARYFDFGFMSCYFVDSNTKNFLSLAGQLRLQQRWAQCPRIPETSVMGHMLIVAMFSYLFTIEAGGCEARVCNNFFGGLFHDLPEVLTRDIVSPVKRSIEGLEDIIKEIENTAVSQKIFPLIPEEWHGEINYYIQDEFANKIIENKKTKIVESIGEKYNRDEFSPIDGEIIRGADHLSAYLEAHLSICHGIQSEPLISGRNKLYNDYKDKSIAGIDFGKYFGYFIY